MRIFLQCGKIRKKKKKSFAFSHDDAESHPSPSENQSSKPRMIKTEPRMIKRTLLLSPQSAKINCSHQHAHRYFKNEERQGEFTRLTEHQDVTKREKNVEGKIPQLNISTVTLNQEHLNVSDFCVVSSTLIDISRSGANNPPPPESVCSDIL